MPNQKREAVVHLQQVVLVGQDRPLSQRRACLVVGLPRQCARRLRQRLLKDQPLCEQMLQLAQTHPRYGYRRIHALLCRSCRVNIKRVHRLWKEKQRQVPAREKHRKRSRNREQHVPQQALFPGHVWSYDFVHDKCRGGAKLKLLCAYGQRRSARAGVSLRATWGAPVSAKRQRARVRAKRPQGVAQGATGANSLH
jgi:putative transposase